MSPDEIQRTIDELSSRDHKIKQAAIEKLGDLGSEAISSVPILIALIKEDDYCWAAVDALGKIGGKEAVKALSQTMLYNTADVRMRAATGLGTIGDTDAIPALIKALKDPNEMVRMAVVGVLAKLGDSTTIPVIQEMANDTSHLVREDSAKALDMLNLKQGSPSGVHTLSDSAVQVPEAGPPALIMEKEKSGNNTGNPILRGGLQGCGTSVLLTILSLIGMSFLRPRLNVADGSQLSLGLGMLPVTLSVIIGALIFLVIIFRAAGFSVLGSKTNVGADGPKITLKTLKILSAPVIFVGGLLLTLNIAILLSSTSAFGNPIPFCSGSVITVLAALSPLLLKKAESKLPQVDPVDRIECVKCSLEKGDGNLYKFFIVNQGETTRTAAWQGRVYKTTYHLHGEKSGYMCRSCFIKSLLVSEFGLFTVGLPLIICVATLSPLGLFVPFLYLGITTAAFGRKYYLEKFGDRALIRLWRSTYKGFLLLDRE